MGTLPAELGNLPHLVHLSFFNQRDGSDKRPGGLTGSIPTELGNLSNLEQLVLDGNHLSGSIPTSLGSLTNLFRLSLNRNELSGSIPTELARLSRLHTVGIANNQLSGQIPAGFANLPLARLSLHDNEHLSSGLPSGLGGDGKLRRLAVSRTDLSGELRPPPDKFAAGVSRLHWHATLRAHGQRLPDVESCRLRRTGRRRLCERPCP